MPAPRFSIVVPTRERPHTLSYCLRTCLDQTFDDYEVVVCDNHSSPATRAVVDGFASPRLRYVRSDTPLSMRENWNLAYSHAQGEFVMFLGDDDGMMPYALSEADRLIREHGVPAVRWDWSMYTWPDVIVPEMANYLGVPLTRVARVLDSKQTIADVVSGAASSDLLPNLYHGIVERRVLEQVRADAGAVFVGWYPDTFSGFAVSSRCVRHLYLTTPLTVIAASGSSNAVAAIFKRGDHPIARAFRNDNARVGERVHPWVPDLPLIPCVLADSFLRAKEAMFPTDASLSLDRRRLAELCALFMPAETMDERRRVMAVIRESLADDQMLTAWFDARFAGDPPPPHPAGSLRPHRMGFDGRKLHLDAAQLGVKDVCGAVTATAALVGSTPFVMDLHAVHDTDARAVAAEAAMTGVMHERNHLRKEHADLHRRLGHAEREGALRNVPRRVARKLLGLVGLA